MEKIQISTQLFIGDQERKNFPFEDIRQRIRSTKKYVDLQNLMIWASDDPEEYQPLVQICQNYDINTYLWFPVLADIPGYDIQEEELLVSSEGIRGYGELGRWEKLGQGDEKFLFMCPNHQSGLDKVFRIYKRLVDQVDFDGVFLDRIRYPSCTNGFESLFTCFCDFCRDKFSAYHDVPLDSYKQAISHVIERLKHITAKALEEWDSLESLWQAAGLDHFFEFRNRNISDMTRTFSEYARSKNKQVGLDLYTPSLAPFVSQDYKLLSEDCDWLKPMSYCHVIGPAGVPLEISSLIHALKALCPNVSEGHLIEFFERVLRVPLPKSAQAIVEQGIPEEFVAKELEKINTFDLPEEIQIYPGIEAVKNPHFSLNIDKNNLENYLSHIHQKADGVIASWNVLYIPDENWEVMGKYSQIR